jgi:hypothetical protein
LEQAGYDELKVSRSTFVLVDSHNLTQSICKLHVDDGFLTGNVQATIFQETLGEIKECFNIKECLGLRDKPTKYLGGDTWMSADGTSIESLKRYVEDMKPKEFKRSDEDDGALTKQGRTALRSPTMQMRWPAQKLPTQIFFKVHSLAKEVKDATVVHIS